MPSSRGKSKRFFLLFAKQVRRIVVNRSDGRSALRMVSVQFPLFSVRFRASGLGEANASCTVPLVLARTLASSFGKPRSQC